MSHSIDYCECVKLGFTRQEINDGVFKDRNGFNCFYMTKFFENGYQIDWDTMTHVVKLDRYDKDSNLIKSWVIDSDENFYFIIELLS